MRRTLILCLTLVLFVPCLWADLSFSVNIPLPDLTEARSTSDLPVMQRPGEPMLPYIPLRILLPPGEKYTEIVMEINESGRKLTDVKIPFFGRQTPISGQDEDYKIDNQFFGERKIYPEKAYRSFGLQRKMGYDILIVNLYPYQYDEVSKTLNLADSYEIRIKTTPDTEHAEMQNRMLLTHEAARQEIRRLVYNPEVVDSYIKNSFAKNGILPDQSEPFKMIVITDEVRSPYFFDYIMWKNENDVSTTLFLLEDIYNFYPGIDNQEKIRNFIIDAYETYSLTETPLEYVLLGGDDVIVPVRGMYCLVNGLWNDYVDYNIPSDVYYSNLDGDWDANGNGIYGELDDGIDWFAEIAVGRIPASSEEDFSNFFRKNMEYASNPSFSNDIAVMIGQNLDSITWGGDYKDEIIPILPSDFHITTFYEMDGTYSSGEIRRTIEEGIGILNHLGHSNQSIVFGMTGSSVNNLQNKEYGLAYSQGCYTAAFDSATTPGTQSIGQRFLTAQGGFFAFIGNTRYGWYWPGSTEGASQLFDITFFQGLFEQDIRHLGKTLNYSKETLVNEAFDNNFQHHLWENGFMLWTFYNQILFGDPSAYLLPANGLFPFIEPLNVVYDDLAGDGDGMVNPGETIYLYIELFNREDWADACSVSLEFIGNQPGIDIILEEASYPCIAAGTAEINPNPVIITLAEDIPYGDYSFTVRISASGDEDNQFEKEYELFIPVSLKQKHWPWESSVPIQGAPLIIEEADQLTKIIAVDALSKVYFLDFEAENIQSPVTNDGNMTRSAAMGDLLNDGNLAIVINNREGIISAINLDGTIIFSYESGSQFINSPVLADFTGDGKLEVSSYGIDRRLFVLSPEGNPIDGFPLHFDQNMLVEMAAADISQDGSAKLIIAFVSGLLDAIDIQGQSLTGFPVDLGKSINLSPIILDNNNIVTGTQDNRLVMISSEGQIEWELETGNRNISEAIVADFSGDGQLDIALVSSNGKVHLVDQSGHYLSGFPVSLGKSVAQSPLAADINNDGLINLILATSDGFIYALEHDGTVMDMFPVPLTLAAASPLFLADIDRDGDFEIGYGTNSGISMMDYKLSAGESTPWSIYRGNMMRSGYYKDNAIITESYHIPTPHKTALGQNYPNPFNVSTTIPFYLESTSDLKITVYNIRGQKIRELHNGMAEEGAGKVFWNGTDENGRKVASGIYLSKMSVASTNQVRKMLLLK